MAQSPMTAAEAAAPNDAEAAAPNDCRIGGISWALHGS